MSGINRVTILGRLGKDPESRQVNNTTVAKFSVATSKKRKDKDGQLQEKTEWHNIVIWDKAAETCTKYLKKGDQAYFEGELQTRSYDDKDGVKKYVTEIVAHTFEFCGSKGDRQEAAPTNSGGYSPSAQSSTDLDSIPF